MINHFQWYDKRRAHFYHLTRQAEALCSLCGMDPLDTLISGEAGMTGKQMSVVTVCCSRTCAPISQQVLHNWVYFPALKFSSALQWGKLACNLLCSLLSRYRPYWPSSRIWKKCWKLCVSRHGSLYSHSWKLQWANSGPKVRQIFSHSAIAAHSEL